MTDSLWSFFLYHAHLPMNKWRDYFPAFERHLARWCNSPRPVTLWEIGIASGGSLQMWKWWLGLQARVVGIDNNEECRQLAPALEIHIGCQSDTAFLARVLAETGPPDIVIDDGSHVSRDQMATWRFLYPRMSPSGVYIVEDVSSSYSTRFEGGISRDDTFIAFSKHAVDVLNADHTRGAIPATSFTRQTASLHFYDGLVVFERGAHPVNESLESGYEPTVEWVEGTSAPEA